MRPADRKSVVERKSVELLGRRETMNRVAGWDEVAVPGRGERGEGEEQILRKPPVPARPEEQARLDNAKEPVDEGEQHPDEQVDVDRPEDRLQVHRTAEDEA